ncbi:hypothetical protein FA95DRAFT_1613679 [Auriscalpium vulgare]|uniref:Uncharacterized protein n=1 Tax=Auriscalpium vulgare TaxID=40419 RepID=A0ACB8R1S1_9AGAM|nr:hypothetical protein FA95DRAFT_1613679 [Auriscalpium vulgare]
MPAHANFYVTIPETGYFIVTFQLSSEGIVSYVSTGPSTRRTGEGHAAAAPSSLVTVLRPQAQATAASHRTMVDTLATAFGADAQPATDAAGEGAARHVVQAQIRLRAGADGQLVVETQGSWPDSEVIVSALSQVFAPGASTAVDPVETVGRRSHSTLSS